MTRREAIPMLAGAATALRAQSASESTPPPAFLIKPKLGRIKQSVCSSVFPRGMEFEEQCRTAAELGFQGYDLQRPERWPFLKKYGLVSSMTFGGGGELPKALNHKENHGAVEKEMRRMLDLCGEAGSPNLITFSGNREGISDAEGMDNCVTFLNRLKSQAEDRNVNICMELPE